MAEVKTDKKNLKLLLILIVPAIIFLVFIVMSKEENVVEEDNGYNKEAEQVPIPEAKTVETKGKVTEYLNEQNKKKDEEYKKSQSDIDSDVFLDEVSKDKEVKKEVVEVATREVKYVPSKTVSKVPIEEKKVVVVVEEKKEEVVEKKQVNDPGGFGIVQSGSSRSSKNNVSSVQSSKKEFFTAMLEEDTKVKNQSSVVFYLLEDCNIDGVVLEKNSILFGKAESRGGVFDISIKQVQLRSGKVIGMSNLYVYDEKYSRGLPCEGALNDKAKESAGESIGDVSSDVASTVTDPSLSLAVNALDKTVRKLSRKEDVSINLSRGYRVYIKKE